MRSFFVVVSAPILQFLAGVVKRQEPMCVQAFGPKATVEAFDKGIVGGFTWSREIEDDVVSVGPQVEIA